MEKVNRAENYPCSLSCYLEKGLAKRNLNEKQCGARKRERQEEKEHEPTHHGHQGASRVHRHLLAGVKRYKRQTQLMGGKVSLRWPADLVCLRLCEGLQGT